MIQAIGRWNATQKTILALLALMVLVGGGWFIWWTASPLFLNKRVSESLSTPVVKALEQGNFVNADDFHKVSGTAKIVDQQGAKVLRLEEDFNSINGPDLHVYLVKQSGLVNDGYVDLGKLKGNQGGQNYPIPAGTDLSQYPIVYIWCQAFGVKFGSAKLL